jgi:WD40 repeat protein
MNGDIIKVILGNVDGHSLANYMLCWNKQLVMKIIEIRLLSEIRNYIDNPIFELALQTKDINHLIQLRCGHIAICSSDWCINIFDRGLKHLLNLKVHNGNIWSLAEVGDYLASGSSDGTIKLLNVKENFELAHSITELGNRIYCITATSSGMLVGALNDGIVKLYDPNKGFSCTYKTDREITSGANVVIEWGNKVAIGCSHAIVLWSYESDKYDRLIGHGNPVILLKGLLGGCLGSASLDNTIRIWDRGLNCSYVLYGHTGMITSIIEHYDGSIVSTASGYDRKMKTWRLRKNGKYKCCTEQSHGSTTLAYYKTYYGNLYRIVDFRIGIIE